MAIDAEISRVGASRLSSSGLPVITATNPIGSEDTDAEHFGEVDLFSALGLSARPAPATRGADGKVTSHAEALVCRGIPGTTGLAIGCRDERAADAYAMLNEGDTALHATGPKHGAMLITREDGRVTMLTAEDATLQGRTVFCEVAPGTDNEPGGNFRVVGPFGKITMGQNGFHVRHYTGARIDLGGIGGLPSPLDSMGAYVGLSAPIVRLESAAVAIGNGVASDNACKATALVAAMTSLNVTLGILASALTSIGAGTTPSAAGQCAAAVAAILETQGAIAAAIPLMPATSVTVS